MIKSITITNYHDESIKFELANPEKSGFLIQQIDGLGPSKADINTTDLSTSDGSLFNSSRIISRNIILKLIFLFKPTIEYVRQLSYKYFPVKKKIKMIVETDNRLCEIYGYVESNEPDIFSSQQGTQISIICPDPHFYSVKKTITEFSVIEPVFEFPFSNESLTENMIKFGDVANALIQKIIYDGDSEVGIDIYIHALGPATNIIMYNMITNESIKINTDQLSRLTGNGIIFGDEIIISTIKGNKHATLLRNGNSINILNCLDRNTDWFQLSKGDNVFSYSATTGVTNLLFRFENKTLYEGV